MQLRIVSALGLIVLLLTGVASAQTARVSRIGLVTDIGKIDDRTFNEFAYKGIMGNCRLVNTICLANKI